MPVRKKASVRPRRHSPDGLKKFGEWTANRLSIAAGAIFVLILAPGIVGERSISSVVAISATAFMLLATGAAFVIFYVTVVRDLPAAGGGE